MTTSLYMITNPGSRNYFVGTTQYSWKAKYTNFILFFSEDCFRAICSIFFLPQSKDRIFKYDQET